MKRLIHYAISVSVIMMPAYLTANEPTANQPGPIILNPDTGKYKKLPSKFHSYILYTDGKACFHTTQPYAFATIVVTDDADEVVGSMIVSPEDSCGNLELYPGCTITCTFDNGATLSAIY